MTRKRAPRDKPPPPLLVKQRGRIVPATAYDAETLDGWPEGSPFEAHPVGKRSTPHHRLFWGVLRSVLAAGDYPQWPTEQKLCDSLKYALHYVTTIWDADRQQWIPTLDSIAFDAMTQAEFNEFHARAMDKLTDWLGYDPLQEERQDDTRTGP